MTTGASHDAIWARISISVLRYLFRGYHPRDFATRLWDGSGWDAEPGQPARFTLVISRPGALRSMLLSASERALGQAYLHGDIDLEGDLECASPMAEHLLTLRPGIPAKIWLASQLLRLPSEGIMRDSRQAASLSGEVHSEDRDRQAVTYHYDTSNDFFSLFLDRRMVYSCAYFQSAGEDLETAQERKLEYTCRKLRLRQGQRLLDIGCGWGVLTLFASRYYGVSALGITLSEPQGRLARERIHQEGLDDRCRVGLRDYRQLGEHESFDALVSIGMVEHVGERKLPEYFAHAWRLLRPGGVFLNHGIARRLGADTDTRGSFTQAYVFPDSDPVPISLGTHFAEEAGFEVRDVESLREHYALTLRHWVHRLERHREEAIRSTDESTFRTWRLFMSASARGFDLGLNNVYQSLLVKPDGGRSGFPLRRDDWYDGGNPPAVRPAWRSSVGGGGLCERGRTVSDRATQAISWVQPAA